MTPLLTRSLGMVLGEGGGDEGGDHPPALLAGKGERLSFAIKAHDSASTLRIKWTRQRCHEVLSTLATAALMPS
jgi:hypothetical protein